MEVFGRQYGPWWDDNKNYLTLIYTRPHSSPFLVKLDAHQWTIVGRLEGTSDHQAIIELIKPDERNRRTDYLDDEEYHKCKGSQPKRCIALEGEKVT
jgi:hypothetical protein